MALVTLGQNLQGPASLIVQFLGAVPAPAMAATLTATWRLRSTSVEADVVLQDMLTPMLKTIQGLLNDLRCASADIRQGSKVSEIRHGAGRCVQAARSVLDLLHACFGQAGPALEFWSRLGLGPHKAFAKMQSILDRSSEDDSPIIIQIRVQHLLSLASAIQHAYDGQLRRMLTLQSQEYLKKSVILEEQRKAAAEDKEAERRHKIENRNNKKVAGLVKKLLTIRKRQAVEEGQRMAVQKIAAKESRRLAEAEAQQAKEEAAQALKREQNRKRKEEWKQKEKQKKRDAKMQKSQIEPQETSPATSTASPTKAWKLKASPASKPTVTPSAPAQLKTMADHTETLQETMLSRSEGDHFVYKLRVRMSLLDRMSEADLRHQLEEVRKASPNISQALRRLFSHYVTVQPTEKDKILTDAIERVCEFDAMADSWGLGLMRWSCRQDTEGRKELPKVFRRPCAAPQELGQFRRLPVQYLEAKEASMMDRPDRCKWYSSKEHPAFMIAGKPTTCHSFMMFHDTSNAESLDPPSPWASWTMAAAKPFVDHYAVLGCSPDSSLEQLKKAYHEKLREFHPDKRPWSAGGYGQNVTQSLNEAWEALRFPALREAYDVIWRREKAPPEPPPRRDRSSSRKRHEPAEPESRAKESEKPEQDQEEARAKAEAKLQAEALRSEGNELYRQAQAMLREAGDDADSLPDRMAAMQKFRIAIKKYSDAMKLTPSNYRLWSNRALCHSALKDWDLCREDRLAALRRLALPSQLSQEVRRRGVHSAKVRQVLGALPGLQAEVAKFSVRSGPRRGFVGRLLDPKLPVERRCVVVYCPSEREGGAGAEECLELCPELLPLGIAIFAIDVSSHGTSHCLEQDVAAAIEMLRQGHKAIPPYPYVALWGRSAGAVAALEAAKDPTLAAIVCDSAYSDLASLLEVPGVLSAPLAGLCQLASGSWLLGPGTDSSKTPTDPVEYARSCFVPGLFLHAAEDELLSSDHARNLRQAHGGEAQLLTMSRTCHDSARPNEAISRAALFLSRAFGLENEAVSRLALYLSRLHPDDATDKIDREAAKLLAAQEVQKRRWGLLMKAVNHCPAYHGASFTRATARGVRPSPAGPNYVKYAILVTLPSASSEVCIAWAAEMTAENADNRRLGTVHFANISCSCLSLTRATVHEDETNQTVHLEDLAVQESSLVPREKPYTMLLALADSGRVEMKLGNCSVQWGRLNQDTGFIASLSLWSASFGGAGLVEFKDELLPRQPDSGGAEPEHHFIGTKQVQDPSKVSLLESLPGSAAELAWHLYKKQHHGSLHKARPPELELPGTLPDEDRTALQSLGRQCRGRNSSELSVQSELSAGTFLSKAADSLALSLSTVQSEEADGRPEDECSQSSLHFQPPVRANTQEGSVSEASEGSGNGHGLARSHTWPDLQEPCLYASTRGRRHTWSCLDTALPILHISDVGVAWEIAEITRLYFKPPAGSVDALRATQLKSDFAKGWVLVAKAMWKEGSRAAALKQIEVALRLVSQPDDLLMLR
ncbi:cbpA, partial [Symbiodinium necroappetens]